MAERLFSECLSQECDTHLTVVDMVTNSKCCNSSLPVYVRVYNSEQYLV